MPQLATEIPLGGYVPRTQNLLPQIFIQHFPAFVDSYDKRYAAQHRKFRLPHVEEVARLLFDVIQSFYTEAAGRPIRTAAVLAFQSFGDLFRHNPYYHGIVLEGGFDAAGRFVFIPLSDLARMTQYLRRRVIKFFRECNL